MPTPRAALASESPPPHSRSGAAFSLTPTYRLRWLSNTKLRPCELNWSLRVSDLTISLGLVPQMISTRRYRLLRWELAIFWPLWRANSARSLSTCDRLKNGVTITWRVRSIFRCHSCFDTSEEFPKIGL